MSGEDQAKAHLDAASRHEAKAREHRLASTVYHKDTPQGAALAQAEWQKVSEESRRLQRRGIHQSSAPADVATWAAHCERHRAALESLGTDQP